MPAARRIPSATISIAAALIAAFVAVDGAAPIELILRGASWGPRTFGGEPWRLVTSAFVHLGWYQLAINVAVIVATGAPLERARGAAAVAIAFGVGAVIGTIASTIDAPNAVIAGASNGAMGLAGALAVNTARTGSVRAWRTWMIAIVLVAIAAGAILLALTRDDVTHAGHLGGALAGAAYATIAGWRR